MVVVCHDKDLINENFIESLGAGWKQKSPAFVLLFLSCRELIIINNGSSGSTYKLPVSFFKRTKANAA